MTRQTTSFTRNADRMPLVNTTPGSSCRGLRCSITRWATPSKNPERCRLATISIMEKSRTSVAKSMLSMAVCRCEHSEDEHAYRPDHRHRGTVDLRARQTSDGEDQVARQEDEPGNDNVKVRQGVADGWNHSRSWQLSPASGRTLQSEYCMRPKGCPEFRAPRQTSTSRTAFPQQSGGRWQSCRLCTCRSGARAA